MHFNHTIMMHYKKSRYPTTKAQKTTHIQLLCNYSLDITTILQLFSLEYEVLINKLQYQKIN
jgi:hypothetical protein